jgi:hypothetical protein
VVSEGPGWPEAGVLGPQSTALFVLLIAMFGMLMWRMVATRRVILRVLAACLAFLSAMLFGIAAVNRYYGYYQTWGAVAADFTSQGASSVSQVRDISASSRPRPRSGSSRSTC